MISVVPPAKPLGFSSSIVFIARVSERTRFKHFSTISSVAARLGSSLDPVPSDPRGLSPIVYQTLFEPRVAQCLLGCDAFGGVVNEYLLQKIEELFVENVGGGNDVLF